MLFYKDQKYNLIFGCWALGYLLTDADAIKFLKRAKSTLLNGRQQAGSIIVKEITRLEGSTDPTFDEE